MNSVSALLLSLVPLITAHAEGWKLDDGKESIQAHGSVKTAAGVTGQSLVLDGSSVIELKDTAQLNGSFTVSVWFNPYVLEGSQQMIVGKNRYSLGERQWGVTIEPDGKMKAHLRQDGWSEITCAEPLKAGHWHLATLTVDSGKAALFLNGKPVGEVKLKKPIPATHASITLGGILDDGKRRQQFHGALDDAHFEPRVMSAEEIAASYRPITATHELPKPKTADFPLWDERVKLAEAKDLPVLDGVEFHVIKKWDKEADGYTFLHGVGLVWHKGKLYASIGHNKGAENTVSEEAQYRVSEDGGKTWSELRVIDAGEEIDLAVSHGVFLSHAGKLWAFHGAYYGKMERIHTRAYSLDEATGQWVKHGVVLENGFWALNQPVKMDDGNWIMPGISAGPYSNTGTFPAAVAISHGDDFTKWDFVSIPVHEGLRMWGESSIIVDGPNVLNIARYAAKPLALISKSTDHGRTWSTMGESNLPMTTSKPAAGLLSTGQRYLVCTNAANNGGKRFPLTIAVSKPGSPLLSQVFVIRHAEHSGPGESNPKAALSYPCATEHEGKLYIGFSNNGGRGGNHNSAEMAVIPVERLK
ncbi:MAG TPA: cycloinulo-oligosaccharide fructanotransferase [Verrucomicrobiales bacterium]|nr:cycloinulo-oligosaccharide fructanotransferase [Verrucomicrobiales bacterium]